jgi:RNA polymerase sigma factor (TIGR02999 family)
MEAAKPNQSSDNVEAGEITRILKAWDEGDIEAVNKLMPFVVNELRQIARRSLRRYQHGQHDNTLQPTVIVSETYLKLRNAKQPHLNRRGDFYALCTEIIKHIIIDYVRRRHAARRNHGIEAESIDDPVFNLNWIRSSKTSSLEDLLVFQETLQRLADSFERESQALSLKYYVGLTDEEIAKTLDVSVPTVRRDLTFARAWVRREVDTITAQIFDQAKVITDAAAREEFLIKACAGNPALLKDVELLLKKPVPAN